MTLLRTQFSALLRRPSRILLTGLALIVASFVVFSTLLAKDSAERTMLDAFSGTPKAVDLVVADDSGGITAETLTALRAVPGVAAATGRVTSYHSIRGSGFESLAITADPGSGPMSTVRLAQGSYPHADGEIALTTKTMKSLQLRIGSRIPLDVTDFDPSAEAAPRRRSVDVTITGAVTSTRTDNEDIGENAFGTEAFVLSLAGTHTFRQLDLMLAPGAQPEAVTAAIGKVLKPGNGRTPSVRTGEATRVAEMEDRVSRIDDLFAFIAMFVAIAVASAVLVATSTFRIVFAQRLRQLALLRAVGAGRLALGFALATEGLVIGAISGALGVAGAIGAGWLVPAVIREFGRSVVAPGIPGLAAVGVIVGSAVLATIAVLGPAFAAARVAPLEALQRAATSNSRTGIGVARAVLGIALAMAAGGAFWLGWRRIPGPDDTSGDIFPVLLLVVCSGTLAFFALVALGPVILRPILAVVAWPIERLGIIGRLATGGVGAAPRRGAAVSLVVAIGVTLGSGVLICDATIRLVEQRFLAAADPGDFGLIAQGASVAGASGASAAGAAEALPAALPAGLVERARQSPRLKHLVPFRILAVEAGKRSEKGKPVGAVVTDLNLRKLTTWQDIGTSAGSLRRLGPGRAVVGDGLARTANLEPGSTFTLVREGRTVSVQIAAIMFPAPLESDVVLDPSDLDRLGAPPTPSGLLADMAGSGDSGRKAALSALRGLGDENVSVVPFIDDRNDTNRTLDLVTAILLALIMLTVLVAVVGVGTTTSLSVVERTRETGMLRAIGLSRGGVRGMITMEAGLYGVIGSVLGFVIAVPYAWLCLESLQLDGAVVQFPLGRLLAVVGVLTLLTALAGLSPAVKAGKVPPVTALAVDD